MSRHIGPLILRSSLTPHVPTSPCPRAPSTAPPSQVGTAVPSRPFAALAYAPCPRVTMPTCPLEGSAFAGRDGCPQPSVRRPTLRSSPSILHTPYSILSHYLPPPNGGLRTTRPTQDSLSGPRLSPCHHAHVSPRRLRRAQLTRRGRRHKKPATFAAGRFGPGCPVPEVKPIRP